MKLKTKLIKLNACPEAIKWVGDRTLEQAWNDCQRSDWMLWYLDKVGYNDEKKLRLIACKCVRSIWHLLEDDRSKQAVIVAEKYAEGKATKKELDAAWDAARAVDGAAARVAAWDAAEAAAWDAARAAAWDAAWTSASDAAMVADGDAAWTSASAAERKKQADIIRSFIKFKEIKQ